MPFPDSERGSVLFGPSGEEIMLSGSLTHRADETDSISAISDANKMVFNGKTKNYLHIDGLPQDCCNSSALALELQQSCTKTLY